MLHQILLIGAIVSFTAFLVAVFRPSAKRRLERHAEIPLTDDTPLSRRQS